MYFIMQGFSRLIISISKSH